MSDQGLQDSMQMVMDAMAEMEVIGDDRDRLKKYLRDHPDLTTPVFHKLFVYVVSQLKAGDMRDRMAKRAELLRRCVDVGVELAFAGY
jgi:hypothetical protein